MSPKTLLLQSASRYEGVETPISGFLHRNCTVVRAIPPYFEADRNLLLSYGQKTTVLHIVPPERIFLINIQVAGSAGATAKMLRDRQRGRAN